jgi:serine/threonine protein kinase
VLLGRLGAGGMGQVFLGVSPSGRRVAVKLIHPVLARTDHFRERFAREIAAARRVGGFHTAPVVDADPQAETPWMVTAYIEGPSLQQEVDRHGPLAPERVRALGAGLSEGLAAIHAHGLVHRDLKPGNVIMAEDGPRIIDFGIARAIGATALTSAGAVVGTFAYMSPEQVRADPVMPASDVFSLGSVLVFAATGRTPFGSDTAATVMFRIVSQPPDLADLTDQELRALIEACLAKSPTDRPQLPGVLASLTGRGALPAAAPPAVPAADGRDPRNQTHPSLWAPARTNPSRDRPPGSYTAPPEAALPGIIPSGTLLPRTVPPGQPVHARPAGGRPRRLRAALIAAVAVVVALAVTIPVLLTAGGPPAAVGHHPSEGSGVSSPATTHGTSRPTTGTSSRSTIPVRDFTLHIPTGVAPYGTIAFSPDGRFLATGSQVNGATHLWAVATGKLAATFRVRSSAGIGGVAFSPDGKLLAAADYNGSVYLWNLAAHRLVATLPPPRPGSHWVNWVAFSPDGKLLASADADGHAYLWNVATGKLVASILGRGGFYCVTFSPDGRLLAAIDGNGTVHFQVVSQLVS